MMNLGNGRDLLAFSSGKFGDDSLRTTRLMRDFAHERRVYFFDQPVLTSAAGSTYHIEEVDSHLYIVRPYLCRETSIFEQKKALLELLKDLMADEHISHYAMWTDTPVAMPLIRNLTPDVIVYDCLKDYSRTHAELERELLQYADSVQTTGKEYQAEGSLRLAKPVQFKDTVYYV